MVPNNKPVPVFCVRAKADFAWSCFSKIFERDGLSLKREWYRPGSQYKSFCPTMIDHLTVPYIWAQTGTPLYTPLASDMHAVVDAQVTSTPYVGVP